MVSIKELLNEKEEKTPLVVEASPTKSWDEESFRQQTLDILKRQENTSWGKNQRKSIALYKERLIKLTKSIHLDFLVYQRGHPGFILNKSCLEVFNQRTKEFLENGLKKENTFLCGIDNYVWILPSSHFRILDKKLEQKEMFYED